MALYSIKLFGRLEMCAIIKKNGKLVLCEFLILGLVVVGFAGCKVAGGSMSSSMNKVSSNMVSADSTVFKPGAWNSGTMYQWFGDFGDMLSTPILVYNTGNTYNLKADGTLTFSYENGKYTATFPNKTPLPPPIHTGTTNMFMPCVYISQNRTAVAFVDNNLQFKLMISNDMGKTWFTATFSDQPRKIYEKIFNFPENSNDAYFFEIANLGFTSKNDGWLILTSPPAAGSEQSIIYKTDDGGNIWSLITDDIGLVNNANFVNTNVGFICNRLGNILRTTDGGKTWSELILTPPAKINTSSGEKMDCNYVPYFISSKGYLTVTAFTFSGKYLFYYISNDCGKTWNYDPSMDKIIQ
jgi:hypothetical protein